jgi:hypothetical protein
MIRKPFLTIVTLVLCLAITGLARADAPTTISINPPTTQVSQDQIGQPFQVQINVTSVTDLWSWKVRVSWNPNVLNYAGIEEGPFMKSAGSTLFLAADQDQTAIGNGYLPEVSCTSLASAGVNGSGVLVTINFTSLTAGNSSIDLTETELHQPGAGNPEIQHATIGGQVTVIPEFQEWLLLPIIFAVTVLVALTRKQFPKRA